MPIFRVKSVKIYTGQKKFTRVYSWLSWQIWGMRIDGHVKGISFCKYSEQNTNQIVSPGLRSRPLDWNKSAVRVFAPLQRFDMWGATFYWSSSLLEPILSHEVYHFEPNLPKQGKSSAFSWKAYRISDPYSPFSKCLICKPFFLLETDHFRIMIEMHFLQCKS